MRSYIFFQKIKKRRLMDFSNVFLSDTLCFTPCTESNSPVDSEFPFLKSFPSRASLEEKVFFFYFFQFFQFFFF